MRQCLNYRSESLAPGHWLTANAESLLGDGLNAAKKTENKPAPRSPGTTPAAPGVAVSCQSGACKA